MAKYTTTDHYGDRTAWGERSKPEGILGIGEGYTFSGTPELSARLNPLHGEQQRAEEAQRRALEDYQADLMRAPDAARRAMRGEIARGMAGAMGQSGAPMGGGSAALLREQALRGGLAGAQFEAETLPALSLARSEAAQRQAELGAARAERSGQRRAELMNQLNAIKSSHSGFFSDDTSAMARDIIALAEVETDPYQREWLYQEASRIRSTPSNMFTNMGGSSI